jgi:hypothetical protein
LIERYLFGATAHRTIHSTCSLCAQPESC